MHTPFTAWQIYVVFKLQLNKFPSSWMSMLKASRIFKMGLYCISLLQKCSLLLKDSSHRKNLCCLTQRRSSGVFSALQTISASSASSICFCMTISVVRPVQFIVQVNTEVLKRVHDLIIGSLYVHWCQLSGNPPPVPWFYVKTWDDSQVANFTL